MRRSKGKRAKLEAAFARALAGEVVIAGALDYRVISTRLRHLQRLFLLILPPKSPDALEIKRRIAEQMYQQALLHGCSRDACRRRFKSLSRLGFMDVERKAHFHLLEARAALSRGENRVARRRTAAMLRELKCAPQRGRNPLRESLLRTFQLLDDSIPR